MSDLPNIEDLLSEITITNEIVWKNRINKTLIDEWLSNYQGEVFDIEYEKILALWLLSNFVFYNEFEVSHLCKTAYTDYLHKRLYDVSIPSVEDGLNAIHSRTMFTSLGKVGESGSMILYQFRTANNIGVGNIQPSARTDYDTIVFLDDVTLSSHSNSQAWTYLNRQLGKYPNKNVHLITLLASETAIDFIENNGISVTNAITLNEYSKVFNNQSYAFHLNGDLRNDAMKFAQHYGSKCLPDAPLGHANSQYLFGFYYNIPDNTLPIIWSGKHGWKPIFRRAHKNYSQTNSDELGHFV